jgi:hypothetical protein
MGRGVPLQPLGVRQLQVLRLPFVEGRAIDPMLAAPTSCSRGIPMICSSVKRPGFMAHPPFEAMNSSESFVKNSQAVEQTRKSLEIAQ